MATKFDPTNNFIFNNYESFTKDEFKAIAKFYNPLAFATQPFDLYFKDQINYLLILQQDPNFQDLMRRVAGLGFAAVEDEFALLLPRVYLFDSEVTDDTVTISINKDMNPGDPKFIEQNFVSLNSAASLFKDIEKQHKAKNLFEDRNFQVPDILNFGLSVRTVTNNFSQMDISSGDDFFPAGKLSADKDETSLTYAYAFEQYQVRGTTELLQKEIKLASDNSEDFIESANNSSGIAKIDLLKNIVYQGELSGEIEKDLIDPGGEGAIGVEKIYNIVNITIPPLPKDPFYRRNILDYAAKGQSPVNPPNTLNTFFNPSNAVDKKLLQDLITQLSFLSYSRSSTTSNVGEIDEIRNFNNQKVIQHVAPSEKQIDSALMFSTEKALTPVAKGAKNKFGKDTKKYLADITNSGPNDFNTSLVSDVPNYVQDFLGSNISILQKYANLLIGAFNTRQPTINPFLLNNTGVPRTNYNISELYQLIYKVQGPFALLKKQLELPDGTRDAYFRNARLSGMKIVKSRVPYDPNTQSPKETDTFNNSIVQSFFIDVRQGDEEKTITLFDSQIIYNREYYYTAFGVYEVDGKYYSYSPVSLKFNETQIPGSKPETVIEPNKQSPSGNPDIPEENLQFVNPCCRFAGVDKKDQIYTAQIGSPPFTKTAKEVADLIIEEKIGEKKLTLKGFSDILTSQEFIPIDNQFLNTNVGGLTDATVFEELPKGKESSILPLINTKDFFRIPFLNFYLYRALSFLKTDTIESKSEFKKDPILGQDKPSVESLAKALKVKKVTDDLYPTNTLAGPSLSGDSILESFQKRKDQLFCFLCRRAGGTINPAKYPTPERLVDRLLKEYDILDSDEKFLGDIIDCREYGYLNADGFGGVLFDSVAEISTRKSPIESLQELNTTKDDSPVTGVPSATFANISSFNPDESSNDKRCATKKLVVPTKNLFESYSFKLTEMDTKFVVEVPFADQKISTVGFAPMPPDVTFIPLADVDNKILIRFQEMVQSELLPQRIDDFLNIYNGTSIVEKLKEQAEKTIGQESKTTILARSQGDLQSIIAVRTTDKPRDLFNLITGPNAQVTEILFKDGGYEDHLLPNKDYWYVFGSRDITGLYSTASSVFRVKIVNDSGYTYVEMEPFEFENIEQKTETKMFKKFLKIKPSFDETIPNNAESIGSIKLFSTIKGVKGTDGAVNTPPKFKIRVRSKKTKRAFDINLKFTQEIQEIQSAKLRKVIEEVAELIDEQQQPDEETVIEGFFEQGVVFNPDGDSSSE